MKRVTFVCTGNVFRSLSAKVCLQNYLKKKKINGIVVDSAGIESPSEGVSKFTREDLEKRGIFFKHKPKKITAGLVKKSDIIISMNLNHQKFLKNNFGVNSILFNKLAYGKNTGILDIEEKYPQLKKLPLDKKRKNRNYKKRIDDVVSHIFRGTPTLAKSILKILEAKN